MTRCTCIYLGMVKLNETFIFSLSETNSKARLKHRVRKQSQLFYFWHEIPIKVVFINELSFTCCCSSL